MSDKIIRLAEHLRDLWCEKRADYTRPQVMATGPHAEQARAMIIDPQRHIDALVEAGVLEQKGSIVTPTSEWGHGISRLAYLVVEPHVHEWRVDSVTQGCAYVSCTGCGKGEYVDATLPLKEPE